MAFQWTVHRCHHTSISFLEGIPILESSEDIMFIPKYPIPDWPSSIGNLKFQMISRDGINNDYVMS